MIAATAAVPAATKVAQAEIASKYDLASLDRTTATITISAAVAMSAKVIIDHIVDILLPLGLWCTADTGLNDAPLLTLCLL
jgi:hypothetical protein